MKKILLIACLLLPLSLTKLSAQVSNSAEFPAGNNANTVGTNMPTQPKYGAVRYDSLLHALPEYTAMEAQLAELRKQHETEAAYNETTFKRMFAEFLQGQKDFPENILLKRQRELQNALERGIAFRREAENLLDKARQDMERPIRQLLDMDVYTSRLEELLVKIEEKLKEIPYVDKLMGIKGIGLATVSGFIAEVGDIGRFDNPKQLQKLAGYAIVANDSGKHNGESRISYRGRKRLRYVLYEAAISLIGKNAEFRAIHEYYRTRKENPLKKMQSVVAVACKVLRIFYTILTKGADYDAGKLMGDIRRPQIQAA